MIKYSIILTKLIGKVWIMRLAQKTVYAIKAIYSLADSVVVRPKTIPAIAGEQEIPAAFLQNIMRELRSAGLVESKRGKDGGYVLATKPENIRVGDVITLFEGDLYPVEGVDQTKWQDELFAPLWDQAAQALVDVYMSVNFKQLVDKGRIMRSGIIHDYII